MEKNSGRTRLAGEAGRPQAERPLEIAQGLTESIFRSIMGVQCGFDSFDITLKWLILVISTLNISRTEWSNTSGLAIWRESFSNQAYHAETSSHYYLKTTSSRIYPLINYYFLHIARPELHLWIL